MHARSRCLAAFAALVLAAQPASGQSALVGELVQDVNGVEAKMVSLARALPDSALAWRPGTGVRSTAEVLLHVASDNYLLPAAVGVQPPAASGISATDFATLTKFEQQRLSRDELVRAIEVSFTHLREAMHGTTEAKLAEPVKFFGQDMTVRQVWLATALHLHEHLGQLIAYTRVNGVTPPWSRAAQ